MALCLFRAAPADGAVATAHTSGPAIMQCYVYKSSRRADTYLYLADRDGFGILPDALRRTLGDLSLVLVLDLAQRSRLAQADIASVRAKLAHPGYYLQLPPSASLDGS